MKKYTGIAQVHRAGCLWTVRYEVGVPLGEPLDIRWVEATGGTVVRTWVDQIAAVLGKETLRALALEIAQAHYLETRCSPPGQRWAVGDALIVRFTAETAEQKTLEVAA